MQGCWEDRHALLESRHLRTPASLRSWKAGNTVTCTLTPSQPRCLSARFVSLCHRNGLFMSHHSYNTWLAHNRKQCIELQGVSGLEFSIRGP